MDPYRVEKLSEEIGEMGVQPDPTHKGFPSGISSWASDRRQGTGGVSYLWPLKQGQSYEDFCGSFHVLSLIYREITLDRHVLLDPSQESTGTKNRSTVAANQLLHLWSICSGYASQRVPMLVTDME